MWTAKFELPDTERDRLITLIAKIEENLASGDAPTKAAFAELVTILGVGEATESKACPSCKRQSRTGASRCGYCWKPIAA